VVFAKQEVVDAAPSFLFGKAAPKIALEAGRCLVALLGSLGEQLHDDCRDGGRDILHPLAWRLRLSGDMAVNPFHWIGSCERKTAGQHLEKTEPQRVEIPSVLPPA